LSDDLKKHVYSRRQIFFGFAGDELDKIAGNHDDMRWWVSDNGLNMAVIGGADAASWSKSVEVFSNQVLDAGYIPSQQRMGAVSGLEPGRSGESTKAPISDPKLRKMNESVTRYEVYKKELRAIKVACKKYQTPDLLKKQFPNFEIWAVLDKGDEVDIAKGAFTPGRFSWSLIKRLNGLGGRGDRTLKNYRRALKDAGILA
jgi:hypothetical protein